ncbi:MAG: thioredoxin domain-containing protein [Patescibacteria group bacterium]
MSDEQLGGSAGQEHGGSGTDQPTSRPADQLEQKPTAGFFDGNPKMIFVFGLVAGIALTYLGGDLLATGAGNARANGDDIAVVDDTNDTDTTATAKKLAAVTDTDHVRGDLDKAKVVLVEYSDYQCPFCQRHHPTMKALAEKYGDDVAWVYRHFPLTSIHPNAYPAALAAECANEQGKFWEFTDDMYENQDNLGDDYYAEVAGTLGMNVSKFTECFESEKYKSVVDADMATARAAGVSGTPATFVNGQLISGAVDQQTFEQLIDAALAK